jgi:RAB protein geranylgeranyltransferase component A
MKDIKIARIAKLRKESRDISKKVLDFGVKEEQKLDIIFDIAISLEDNRALKEITEVIKKFRESINTDTDSDNNDKSKKILT